MRFLSRIFDSAYAGTRRPVLDDRLESNLPGVYIAGDLAGAPVVKLAMKQGTELARRIVALGEGTQSCEYDVVVAGSGAAGLSAALELQATGLRVVVIEKGQFASTVAELPEGKWIYAEPNDLQAGSRLTLIETTKEELVSIWREDVRRAGLEVRTGEALTGLRRERECYVITTSRGELRARRVILAIGKAGTPRRLDVPGEDASWVEHRLYQTQPFENKRIVVIGGGNSAAEAAIALSARNQIVLLHRGESLLRVTRENRRRLEESSVEILAEARVSRFGTHEVELDTGRTIAADHAFVLIGSDPPVELLRALGIQLEGDWRGRPIVAAMLAAASFGGLAAYGAAGSPLWLAAAFASIGALLLLALRSDRYALLAFCFTLAYGIYGTKQAHGHEFWPFQGWGAQALTLLNRPWAFWYTAIYTALMTVFGIQALRRWGTSRGDRFQTWRYVSLIGFQWIFFFLIPEFLFQWAAEAQWIQEAAAREPWRAYGIVYAWPLFFYTFFGDPHEVWIVWGLFLSFVLIPLLVLFHGKRYCSWICGCGGLAETVGDRWRHLAPKGPASIRWERMNSAILAAAVVITVMVAAKDVFTLFGRPAQASLVWYRLIADVWLVGIVPVTLYPFFGGKVWCRYWCPLAKMMELFSAWFTRFRTSRFSIQANEKCIACGDCTRNCQVGIDVMRYALAQEQITNANSSCIGCGICVTVCPMDVLSFARPRPEGALVQITKAA